MGSCSDTCGTSPHCAGCPFKPKFGCCELLDGTDSCARTAYFAAMAMTSFLPQHATKLCQFIGVARDLTELLYCAKDFYDVSRNELFDSESRLERASDGMSLAASVVTPFPILIERGFLNLGDHLHWIAPLATALSATGHGLALMAAVAKQQELEAADSSLECLYQLSELVESFCPKPLIVSIGVATGTWKLGRTLQRPQEVAPAA